MSWNYKMVWPAETQLTFGGYTPNDIRRAIRRREMQLVHRGVCVTHTGPLTWRQRAWAAVLYAEPASSWRTTQ